MVTYAGKKRQQLDPRSLKKAADLRDQEKDFIAQIAEWRKSWTESRNQFTPDVKAEDIAAIVSEWTGIPVTQLTRKAAGCSEWKRDKAETHRTG